MEAHVRAEGDLPLRADVQFGEQARLERDLGDVEAPVAAPARPGAPSASTPISALRPAPMR